MASLAHKPMRLVLASKSQARRAMLEAVGVPVETVASQIDEAALQVELDRSLIDGLANTQVAHSLARAKAEDVSRRFPDALVIGADQTLVLSLLNPLVEGAALLMPFHKPVDMADARKHLWLLRGRTHQLRSVVVLAKAGREIWSGEATAQMSMRQMSDEFVGHYLEQAGSAVFSCVGAYEYEGLGAQLFEAVEGDYFTILGMPLLPLLAELRRLGVLAT